MASASNNNSSSSRCNNSLLRHPLLLDPLPLPDTQIAITAGAGTSRIVTVSAIGTEIESALNARGLKETETENEIRGTQNALKQRE